MNISMTPYQKNNDWYVKDIAATSPVASGIATTQTQQTTTTHQSKVTANLNQISKITPSMNGLTFIQGRDSNKSDTIQSATYNSNGAIASNAKNRKNTSDTDQTGNSDSLKNITPDENNEQATAYTDGNPKAASSSSQLTDLSEEELALLQELKKADSEVRTHEMAHIAAGGQYVTSGAQLDYRKGPDGGSYAVAGEVSIDTSPISGDPEATAAKMRQVQRAALAPASPSNQDRKVAISAGSLASKAMAELITEQAKERSENNENRVLGNLKNENRTSGDIRNAANSYSKISSMPVEPQESQFKIAV